MSFSLTHFLPWIRSRSSLCLASFSHSSEAKKLIKQVEKTCLGVSGSKELLLDSLIVPFRDLWEFLGYSYKSTAIGALVWIHVPSLTSSIRSVRRARWEIPLPGVRQQCKPVQENRVQDGALALMRVLTLLVAGLMRFCHACSQDLLSALAEAGNRPRRNTESLNAI